MTGLIDRAGTLEGAECETQKLPDRCNRLGINLFGAMQVTLITYTLVLKEMYFTAAMTIIKIIVVVIYTKLHLKDLLNSDSYHKQKQRFMHDFCRKCEQAKSSTNCELMNFNDLNNTTPNNLNVPNTTLLDTIHVERVSFLQIYVTLLFKILKRESGNLIHGITTKQDTYGSEETMELDVQPSTPELQQLLTPIIIQAGAAYNQKYTWLKSERTQTDNE